MDTAALAGVGVGSPGSVDDKKGTVSAAMNLSEWQRLVQPAQGAREGAGHARLARQRRGPGPTDAEFEIGAAREYDTLLGVFWGTGVGGGLVMDGHPWVGRGTAGEIGHMVVRVNGAHVRLRAARLHGGLRGLGRHAWRPARAGASRAETSPRCSRSWRSAAATVCPAASGSGPSRATTSSRLELLEEGRRRAGKRPRAVNLLDPEAVVIGGGLGIRLGEPWVEEDPARRCSHTSSRTTTRRPVTAGRTGRPGRRARRGAAGGTARAPRARRPAPALTAGALPPPRSLRPGRARRGTRRRAPSPAPACPPRPWPSPSACGLRWPVSRTCSPSDPSRQATRTLAGAPPACLWTFASASWTIRYADSSSPAEIARGRPST